MFSSNTFYSHETLVDDLAFGISVCPAYLNGKDDVCPLGVLYLFMLSLLRIILTWQQFIFQFRYLTICSRKQICYLIQSLNLNETEENIFCNRCQQYRNLNVAYLARDLFVPGMSLWSLLFIIASIYYYMYIFEPTKYICLLTLCLFQ